MNRRVKEVIKDKLNSNNVVSEKVFIYHGFHMIAEYSISGSTFAPERAYYWGADISGTYGGAGGIGGLQLIHDIPTNKSYTLGYDHQGNVLLVYGINDQHVISEYEYDPYGVLDRTTGWEYDSGNDEWNRVSGDPINNSFRYQTKWVVNGGSLLASHYNQKSFELYDFGFRFYLPWQGRFVNKDPIGELGGANLYAYVGNDPVNRFDLLGAYADMIDMGNNTYIVNVPMDLSGLPSNLRNHLIPALNKFYSGIYVDGQGNDLYLRIRGESVPILPGVNITKVNSFKLVNPHEMSNLGALAEYDPVNSSIKYVDGVSLDTLLHEIGHAMGLDDRYIQLTFVKGSIRFAYGNPLSIMVDSYENEDGIRSVVTDENAQEIVEDLSDGYQANDVSDNMTVFLRDLMSKSSPAQRLRDQFLRSSNRFRVRIVFENGTERTKTMSRSELKKLQDRLEEERKRREEERRRRRRKN